MDTPSVEQAPVPAAPAPKPARRFSLFGSKRTRFLLNIGCVPVMLVGTFLLLLVLNVTSFWQAPSWVSDPQTYLASGRILLSLATVGGLQALATWAVGLAAALLGLRAAAGQGAYVARRLEVVRRRIEIAAWAIVALRLVLVLVVMAAVVYLYTSFFGFRLSWDLADEAAGFVSQYPAALGLALAICLAQWLAGPLLRLRFSAALGALAGAWAQDRDQRPWLALSLRLGSELAGMVGVLWVMSLLRILAGVAFDPLVYPVLPQYPDLFPLLPPRTAAIATGLLILAAVLVFHTLLQIGLTQLALNAASRRLAHPPKPNFYDRTGETFREMARSSRPKGETG